MTDGLAVAPQNVSRRPTIRRVTAIRFPRTVGDAFPSELELRVAGLTLRGTSVAARATAFAIPEFGVALDVGRMSPTIAAQPVVLLSHGHLSTISLESWRISTCERGSTRGSRRGWWCQRAWPAPLRRRSR